MELKSCPFCGERATIYQLYGGYDYIRCINVECILNDDVEIFPQTWNTRPIEDELQHKLDEEQKAHFEEHTRFVKLEYIAMDLQKELDRQREINKTIAHDIQKGAREGYKQLVDVLQSKLDIAVEALKYYAKRDDGITAANALLYIVYPEEMIEAAKSQGYPDDTPYSGEVLKRLES